MGKRIEEKIENRKLWLELGINIEKRRIRIDDDIDTNFLGVKIAAIQEMIDIDSDTPIDVYINSDGGFVYDGLEMYDTLVNLPCVVRTHACGKVMSMALIIYLAGDERYCQKNATFMNHSVSSLAEGKIFEMDIDANEARRINNLCIDILSEKTNMKKDWWKKHLRYEDKYYDETKATELGIVTHPNEE